MSRISWTLAPHSHDRGPSTPGGAGARRQQVHQRQGEAGIRIAEGHPSRISYRVLRRAGRKPASLMRRSISGNAGEESSSDVLCEPDNRDAHHSAASEPL
jgi:hypothetical protein